ncbi:MAG: nucleotidyltransferase domain-containing protein [Candidatus Nanohaloarchaea archaeon]
MSQHRKAFNKFREKVSEDLEEEVDKIVLFGSVARREEDSESDVDILVVVKDREIKEKIFDISYSIMLDYDIYISPKVVDQEEFDEIKNSPFMQEIQKEMQVYEPA